MNDDIVRMEHWVMHSLFYRLWLQMMIQVLLGTGC